ncbi:MAG: VWA domain-containing protein [Vicinamibacterales bacterium]
MAARRRLALGAVAIAAVALAAAGLSAQEPVFRASVETVTVDVSVTRNGAPVTGLEARHFVVRDNGVAQTVDRVMFDEVPLHLLLVFDTSSSLGTAGVRTLADAAGALVNALKPTDQVGLITFSESVDVRVPLTQEHDRVRRALGGGTASGPTAWRDALFVATQLFEPRLDTRRVVLLFTDGRDTSSWMAASEIRDVVRRSGVVLHAVDPPAPPPSTDPREAFSRISPVNASTPRSLRDAVDAGGGRLWMASSGAGLRERFLAVLDELRSRYLISYAPTGPRTPGWHEVSVAISDARGDVRARPGYWVPSPR